MTHYLDYELGQIAHAIIHDMLSIKPQATVVITSDSGSNLSVVDALARAAHTAKAYPVIMQTPQFKGRLTLVDQSIPTELFFNALTQADIWIDANSNDFLYSGTFDRVLAHNKTLRYLYLGGDLPTHTLAKLYAGHDAQAMIAFCDVLKKIVTNGKTATMTNPQGTKITLELEPTHFIAVDGGEATAPGMYTPPALLNIVPRFGSVNGTVVFDALYDAYPDKIMDKPLALTLKDSVIVSAEGNRYAEKFMEATKSWDDNGRKVAHINFGLLPTITELTGNVVIDERVWGVLNWGFGSVTPLDAPPDGQPSDFHFDAICTDGSVSIDGVPITENGTLVHPDLKELAAHLCV